MNQLKDGTIGDLVAAGRAVYSSSSDADRNLTCLQIVDTLGCILVASTHPMINRMADYIVENNVSSGGVRPLSVPSTMCSVDKAVLIDAVASHVDELDAIHPKSAMVPSGMVIPAALTVGSRHNVVGSRLIDAVLAGYEVMIEAGLRFGGAEQYKSSWWPSALFGALGSAAATCVLLDLDEEKWMNALGIAAAGVGGLLSEDVFSEGHYLLFGNAAARGVEAAYQSKLGMQASWSLLDDPAGRALGINAARSEGHQTPHLASCLAKRYPCARPLHSALDGLRELRSRGVDFRQLERVKIGLPEPLLAFVSDEIEVFGPSEAAASAAFAVAAFCEGSERNVEFYRKAKIDVARWRNVVSVVPSQNIAGRYPERWGAEVEVVDRHGIEHSIIQDELVDPDPFSTIERKFLLNVGGSSPALEEWLIRARDLDKEEDVSTFMEHTFAIGAGNE